MTIDLLRTQTKDLLDWWTDREGHDRPALLHLLAVQLAPVRMADSEQNVKAKITDGPAPWDDQVAHLLADISAGARTIERGLDIALGFQPRQRGGSDGNTRHALSRIPGLVDALTGRTGLEDLIVEPRITIGAWHRAALLLLGAERRWAHIRGYRAMGSQCDRCDGSGRIFAGATVMAGESHEPVGELPPVDCPHCGGTGQQLEPAVATCPYCGQPIRIQPDLADQGDHHRHRDHNCTLAGCAQLPRIAAQAAAPTGNAWAFCVNTGCTDDDGIRRAWPVDPWLGQLVTWKRDTTQKGAA